MTITDHIAKYRPEVPLFVRHPMMNKFWHHHVANGHLLRASPEAVDFYMTCGQAHPSFTTMRNFWKLFSIERFVREENGDIVVSSTMVYDRYMRETAEHVQHIQLRLSLFCETPVVLDDIASIQGDRCNKYALRLIRDVANDFFSVCETVKKEMDENGFANVTAHDDLDDLTALIDDVVMDHLDTAFEAWLSAAVNDLHVDAKEEAGQAKDLAREAVDRIWKLGDAPFIDRESGRPKRARITLTPSVNVVALAYRDAKVREITDRVSWTSDDHQDVRKLQARFTTEWRRLSSKIGLKHDVWAVTLPAELGMGFHMLNYAKNKVGRITDYAPVNLFIEAFRDTEKYLTPCASDLMGFFESRQVYDYLLEDPSRLEDGMALFHKVEAVRNLTDIIMMSLEIDEDKPYELDDGVLMRFALDAYSYFQSEASVYSGGYKDFIPAIVFVNTFEKFINSIDETDIYQLTDGKHGRAPPVDSDDETDSVLDFSVETREGLSYLAPIIIDDEEVDDLVGRAYDFPIDVDA